MSVDIKQILHPNPTKCDSIRNHDKGKNASDLKPQKVEPQKLSHFFLVALQTRPRQRPNCPPMVGGWPCARRSRPRGGNLGLPTRPTGFAIFSDSKLLSFLSCLLLSIQIGQFSELQFFSRDQGAATLIGLLTRPTGFAIFSHASKSLFPRGSSLANFTSLVFTTRQHLITTLGPLLSPTGFQIFPAYKLPSV